MWLLHLVQRGGDWAGPQSAQALPRCTKCNIPSTASVPITVLLYNGPVALWYEGIPVVNTCAGARPQELGRRSNPPGQNHQIGEKSWPFLFIYTFCF